MVQYSYLIDLKYWVDSPQCNTALVVLVAGHFNVSFVSPAGTPGVLNQPVIGTVLITVTYHEDPVVDLPGASRVVVYAASVELVAVGVEGYGNWPNRS